MVWMYWKRAREIFDYHVTPEDLLCKHPVSPRNLRQFGISDEFKLFTFNKLKLLLKNSMHYIKKKIVVYKMHTNRS